MKLMTLLVLFMGFLPGFGREEPMELVILDD